MIVFDLETQNLAHEVGGWANKSALRLAVGCTFDDEAGYQLWWESQAADLLKELHRADMVIGFNVNRFDYQVLDLYGQTSELEAKTFDIHQEIYNQAHRRIGLDRLCQINLGEAKTLASGVTAVELWRTGKLEELAAYCQSDVELTKKLYDLWESQGILWVSEMDYVIWPGTAHLAIGDDDE